MRKTFNPCDDCDYSFGKQNQYSEMCHICEFKKYRDFEEQGLLLKLPCKVGDRVYMPYLNTILERKIDVINIYRHTMRIHLCNTSLFVEPEDFGKTVFLTQSEAEEALRT